MLERITLPGHVKFRCLENIAILQTHLSARSCYTLAIQLKRTDAQKGQLAPWKTAQPKVLVSQRRGTSMDAPKLNLMASNFVISALGLRQSWRRCERREIAISQQLGPVQQ